MTQVFAKVHYGVLTIPGFFEQLYAFVGHFQIQQTVFQSYDKVFELWFFTDKVEIKEGESRQVDILCTRSENNGELSFKIEKF